MSPVAAWISFSVSHPVSYERGTPVHAVSYEPGTPVHVPSRRMDLVLGLPPKVDSFVAHTQHVNLRIHGVPHS